MALLKSRWRHTSHRVSTDEIEPGLKADAFFDPLTLLILEGVTLARSRLIRSQGN